jgi:hypothetical protein
MATAIAQVAARHLQQQASSQLPRNVPRALRTERAGREDLRSIKLRTMDDALRDELLTMASADPAFRSDLDGLGRRDKSDLAAEQARTKRMQAIIWDHGWPGWSMVAEDGSSAAWLLLQQADGDVDFQERALELLDAALAVGEASLRESAYLTDRLSVNRGRPQGLRHGIAVVRRRSRGTPNRLPGTHRGAARGRRIGTIRRKPRARAAASRAALREEQRQRRCSAE